MAYREKLREWEVSNAALYTRPDTTIGEQTQPGDILNLVGKSSNGSSFEVAPADGEWKDQNESFSEYEKDGAGDIGSDRTYLLPGDMVSIK